MANEARPDERDDDCPPTKQGTPQDEPATNDTEARYGEDESPA